MTQGLKAFHEQFEILSPALFNVDAINTGPHEWGNWINAIRSRVGWRADTAEKLKQAQAELAEQLEKIHTALRDERLMALFERSDEFRRQHPTGLNFQSDTTATMIRADLGRKRTDREGVQGVVGVSQDVKWRLGIFDGDPEISGLTVELTPPRRSQITMCWGADLGPQSLELRNEEGNRSLKTELQGRHMNVVEEGQHRAVANPGSLYCIMSSWSVRDQKQSAHQVSYDPQLHLSPFTLGRNPQH